MTDDTARLAAADRLHAAALENNTRLRDELAALTAERDELAEANATLTRQVDRVRSLHSPMVYGLSETCGTCPDWMSYPCPTRAALDGGAG